MTHYIFIETDNNNKINGSGECKRLDENIYNFEATDEFYEEFSEMPEKYIAAPHEEEVEVPDFETVEEEYEVEVPDEVNGETVNGEQTDNEEEIEPIQPTYHTETRTREVERQTGSHIETITVYEIVINPNWEEEQAEKERQRINNLTMTPLDFIVCLQTFGLTLEQINAYLESHLDVKMQLTYCNNVYCGVAKSMMPITVPISEETQITITEEMVERMFRAKYDE